MRFWLGLTSVAIAAAATPSVARAELGGGVIKVEIRIPADPAVDSGSTDPTDFIDGTDEADLRYFNLARCVCDSGGDDQNYLARVNWETRPTMGVTGQLYLWAGTTCESGTPQERDAKCTELDPIMDVNELDRTVDRVERVRPLLTPNSTMAGCDPDVTKTGFGVYSSTDGGSTLTVEKLYEVAPVDMKAPEVPTSIVVNAQEGQIEINWDEITVGIEDYEYFQALCTKADGTAAHEDPTHTSKFDTTYSVCETPIAALDAATIENDDMVVGDPVTAAGLPVGLAQMSDSFICGEASGTSEGITLNNLDDGVAYIVVLVAVDNAGNSTAVYIPRTVTPQPVTDFWEDANDEDPGIEGGLCLVEATYGAGGGGLNGALRAWRDELRQTAAGRWFVERYYAWGAPLAAAASESVVARVVIGIVMLPLVAVALVWHAIGLPAMLAIALALVWLRRRRKLIIAATIALAPSVAAAQSVTPYWDDELADESSESTGPQWHFGIRLGPYLPEIDDERFMDPGPYERMFGKGSWMPAMDLHRLWGTRFGQFGGGVSLGYFSKTADAYIPGTMPVERAEGNENSLTIIPVELTAIWRASQLHDNWGIPLIPYVRGGLGYYLWWVRRPDGEYAKHCPSTPCDRAIGGSLGLVGAAGLSVRAEGIDPDAARSMRDSGLDHAGFYAELEMAWVDGFGDAKKLSLGDTTWFAGIDFEF